MEYSNISESFKHTVIYFKQPGRDYKQQLEIDFKQGTIYFKQLGIYFKHAGIYIYATSNIF